MAFASPIFQHSSGRPDIETELYIPTSITSELAVEAKRLSPPGSSSDDTHVAALSMVSFL